jgi:Dyp-type peroxidase family
LGSAALALDNIQGNVVPGFNKDHQAFVFVHFRGREEGRNWLAALQPRLASASDVAQFRRLIHQADAGAPGYPRATWSNVALSFAGLRLLRPADNLTGFSAAFRGNRVPGANPTVITRAIHALLIIAADRDDELAAALVQHQQEMASAGVEVVLTLRGDTLPGALRGHEHFGFRDGVSQPRIAGTDWGTGQPVSPGEFVLGYPDEAGKLSGAGLPAWSKNGSFLAFLQLQQHVTAFWSAMQQAARHSVAQPEDLAAWIVGRKHDADGTQLSEPPARTAHIGRAYSRWLPDAQRHRVIRRGIPYGPPLPEGQPDDGQERGLFFVTYQADLNRQFEHVWTRWLGDPDFPMRSAGTDALVGQAPNTARPATAASNARPGAYVSLSLPAFVTPRYGGYFFAPDIQALPRLSNV